MGLIRPHERLSANSLQQLKQLTKEQKPAKPSNKNKKAQNSDQEGFTVFKSLQLLLENPD
jgi:hypothetical protein